MSPSGLANPSTRSLAWLGRVWSAPSSGPTTARSASAPGRNVRLPYVHVQSKARKNVESKWERKSMRWKMPVTARATSGRRRCDVAGRDSGRVRCEVGLRERMDHTGTSGASVSMQLPTASPSPQVHSPAPMSGA
jgi:hypothetical protein